MKRLNALRLYLPFILFSFVFFTLWRSLSLHPNTVPSPLINKPAPPFALPTLMNPSIISSQKDFLGKVTLVNVWASWCTSCITEQAELMQINQNRDLQIYGINYKDDPHSALTWLKEHGNPYKIIVADTIGNVSIDWGVYGTPETFIVDKHGIIRYKQIGPISEALWKTKLSPFIEQLQNETDV